MPGQFPRYSTSFHHFAASETRATFAIETGSGDEFFALDSSPPLSLSLSLSLREKSGLSPAGDERGEKSPARDVEERDAGFDAPLRCSIHRVHRHRIIEGCAVPLPRGNRR